MTADKINNLTSTRASCVLDVFVFVLCLRSPETCKRQTGSVNCKYIVKAESNPSDPSHKGNWFLAVLFPGMLPEC